MSSKAKRESGSSKVLRTTAPALSRPSERRKLDFRASVGEKEDDLEIQLLNLGFLVKEKLFVAEGKNPETVVFLEAATKDGLGFFVALSPGSYLLAREGEKVGTYASRGQSRLIPEKAVTAVLGALDYLCGAAFVAHHGYSFFEYDNEATAPRVTTIIFGTDGSEPHQTTEEDESIAACAAAFPLVEQGELLANPEEVRNNIREAWRRLYELRSECSSSAMQRLKQRICDVTTTFDKLAGTVESASMILIDSIAQLTPAQAQLKASAPTDPQENARLASVEEALAVRYQNLRQLHQTVAEVAEAADLLNRARAEIQHLEETLCPMRDLAIQQSQS